MTVEFDRLKAELSDSYELHRELGSGGMATVFLARDLKHGRQVAVKVLRPELAAAVGSERFLREIEIAARLNHRHILPLLDSGASADFVFYVTPHLSGGSLRLRLERDRRIPIGRVIRIAGEVGSALDHAHRHDVIHRDVKPENILFSDGLAIVADFGVAKALSEANQKTLTRSGFPLGTPGYMSPEQATVSSDLDERTDVYGLAAVVYESLVGETPGMWPTDEAVRVGRFIDATSEHRDELDLLPGRVEQVLARALALRPANRFATPGLFSEALAAAVEPSGRLQDDEAREIIERAVELDDRVPAESQALSLGGVEQAAAAVGIPPETVCEAAAALSRPATSASPPAVLGGGPGTGLIEGDFFGLTGRLELEESISAAVSHVATWGGQYALIRSWYRRIMKRRSRVLRSLLDSLSGYAEEFRAGE